MEMNASPSIEVDRARTVKHTCSYAAVSLILSHQSYPFFMAGVIWKESPLRYGLETSKFTTAAHARYLPLALYVQVEI